MKEKQKDPPNKACGACSGLSDVERAMQKFGSDNDTFLPEAAKTLADIHDFNPLSSRKRILKQCRQCGTYYLYETDYEYLVNGTEDEEMLKRISCAEADELLREAGRWNKDKDKF